MVVLHPRYEDWDDESNSDSWPLNHGEDDMTPGSTSYPFGPSVNPYDYSPSGKPSRGWWSTLSTQTIPEGSQQTSSTGSQPVSDNGGPITSLTSAASDNVPQSTSTNTEPYGGFYPTGNEREHSSHGGLYAVAGVVPVAVMAILGVAIFFYLRRRKRQRRQAAATAAGAKMQEMKARSQTTAQPYYTAPPPVQQSYTSTSTNSTPPPPAPSPPQPVILGPIAPESNGAYYTGIDTSDIMSVTDRTGLGNPFADTSSLAEEPPPPYRPRSVATLSRNTSVRTDIAPLSRDTSLRASNAMHSQTNLIPERSPFADPDEDAVSDISGPTVRREQDTLSVVSDLSYQDEPTTSRPTI